MRRFLILVLLAALLCGIVYDSIVTVPDGTVGVATFKIRRLGQIPRDPRKLDPGLHLSLPFVTNLRLYNTRVQMLFLDVPLPGGKLVRMTAQVRLHPDSALAVDERLGPDYLKGPIKATLTELLKKEIYDSHGNISSPERQQSILDIIGATLGRDGLSLDEAFLTRLEHLDLKDVASRAEESDTDENQE